MIRKLNEKLVFQTKFFKIKDVLLENKDKKQVTYQIIEKKNSTLLVPLTSDNNILFIEEFYPAINQYQLGLPKGRIDEGYNELQTANKELQEEVGYKANKLDSLGILTLSPGYLTQKTYIYLARELQESKLDTGDELEKLKIVKFPLNKFEELIEKGKLTEARMVAALFLTRSFLKINEKII